MAPFEELEARARKIHRLERVDEPEDLRVRPGPVELPELVDESQHRRPDHLDRSNHGPGIRVEQL